jgi:hypothetical protein
MSALRPGQAKWDDGARLLRAAAGRRRVAATDLFMPGDLRLSERERVTARALLVRLLRVIEDELRAAIADRFRHDEPLHAALASTHVEIAGPALGGSDLLAEPELVGLLLRRVEEHRLFLAGPEAGERLKALVADRDEGVAADAMAVLVARGRRLDRFGEPVLARTELPAELQHRLVWTVAAALRNYLAGIHHIDASAADACLREAGAATIAAYDEADTLEARCGRLARRLRASDRLDGEAIAGFLEDGLLPLFIAGLSAVTAIPAASVWDILTEPAGQGPVLLLKAAGLDRGQAGRCLLLLAGPPSDDWIIEQIDLFDALTAQVAASALSLWSLDPVYRDALLALGEGRLAA